MFAGQWIGTAEGDVNGLIVLDLDDGPEFIRGTGRLFVNQEPGTICEIRISKSTRETILKDVPLFWMPVGEPRMISVEQARATYKDYRFSSTADIVLERLDSSIVARWTTDTGLSSSAILHGSMASTQSVVAAELLDWEQFKEKALSHLPGSKIFRGQPTQHRLRTAFHRTYRKDLIKYVAEDIPLALRQLTARTKHLFNLANPMEQGAFYNLLQHHGYPTPLLDWTYSPFVAAFFAYRRNPSPNQDRVRILSFDKTRWASDFNQIESINFTAPHFSVLEALAIENPRAIPQQALSTLTNVDDIEAYIAYKEQERGHKYLTAVDLPAVDRPRVMAELSLMGITAGSLFPGLDGACEELMGRMFHHQVAPTVAK